MYGEKLKLRDHAKGREWPSQLYGWMKDYMTDADFFCTKTLYFSLIISK